MIALRPAVRQSAAAAAVVSDRARPQWRPKSGTATAAGPNGPPWVKGWGATVTGSGPPASMTPHNVRRGRAGRTSQ